MAGTDKEKYLVKMELDLTATLDVKLAYSIVDFVVIAVPTNVYPKFSVDFSWAMMTLKIIHYCWKMSFRVQVWGK